jgi:hypothetical protein
VKQFCVESANFNRRDLCHFDHRTLLIGPLNAGVRKLQTDRYKTFTVARLTTHGDKLSANMAATMSRFAVRSTTIC